MNDEPGSSAGTGTGKPLDGLSQGVDSLRDTILKLSERLEQLKAQSPAATVADRARPSSPVHGTDGLESMAQLASPSTVDTAAGGSGSSRSINSGTRRPSSMSAASRASPSGLFLSVTVSDPRNHEVGHTSYRLVTRTNLPQYDGDSFVVRRRFAEFEWLHNQLQETFPDVPLLPLPPKRILGRLTDEVVQERLRSLRTLMQFVSKHRQLRASSALRTFLTACAELGLPTVLPASAPAFLRIRVADPRTMSDAMGVFVTYAIHYQTNMPLYRAPPQPVRRRYREFEWLRTQLSLRFPQQALPPLPPKGFLARFSPAFIADRHAGLQAFVDALCSVPVFVASDLLRVFCTATADLSVADFSMWSVLETERWLQSVLPEQPAPGTQATDGAADAPSAAAAAAAAASPSSSPSMTGLRLGAAPSAPAPLAVADRPAASPELVSATAARQAASAAQGQLVSAGGGPGGLVEAAQSAVTSMLDRVAKLWPRSLY